MTYIVALSAWRSLFFGIMPLVVYAESEEDAEVTAITAARMRIFPEADGWSHHFAMAKTVEELCSAIEIEHDEAVKATWRLCERIEEKKAEASA